MKKKWDDHPPCENSQLFFSNEYFPKLLFLKYKSHHDNYFCYVILLKWQGLLLMDFRGPCGLIPYLLMKKSPRGDLAALCGPEFVTL